MNDRFKFRAWDKKNEVMIPFCDNYICEEYSGIIFVTPENHQYSGIGNLPGSYENLEDGCHYSKQYELMQCTGLKDKNGELIYEGDILSLYGFNKKQNEEMERSVVKWDYQEASYYFGSVTSYNEDNSSFSNIEIIGNIYENPELKENE